MMDRIDRLISNPTSWPVAFAALVLHRELSKQNLLREEFQAMIPALLAEADQQAKEAAARQKETHPSTEARIAAVWRREGRTR